MGGRCWWSWWAITDEGRRELRALRAEAWQEIRHRPDPVDLALAMSDDLDEDTLRGYLDDRIRVLSARTAQFDHERDRAWPDQTVADDLVIEHARLRLGTARIPIRLSPATGGTP